MLYANFLLIGAAQGFFLSLLLARARKGVWSATRLLSLLTCLFSLDLAVNYCGITGVVWQYPSLVFVEVLVVFLYGPLLYLTVAAFTADPGLPAVGRRWLHFLPFLVALPLLLPVVLLGQDALRAVLSGEVPLQRYMGAWSHVIVFIDVVPRVLIGVYLVLSFRVINRHRQVIRNNFSEITSISLAWLQNLLLGFAAIYGLYLLAAAAGEGGASIERLLNVAMAVLVYALGYRGLRQPLIFRQHPDDVSHASSPTSGGISEAPAPSRRKYESSALDASAASALFDELETLMREERPYLEHDLSLRSLAARLRLPPNYLSQAINQQAGRNFYDYVNGYRVEAAKSALADPARDNASVLTIAMDAGFNSKSAFYATFKAYTGMTPAQFRRVADHGHPH